MKPTLQLILTGGPLFLPAGEAPMASAIRLSLELPDVGVLFVCQTPPDVERTRTAWRLLAAAEGSAIVAQRIDEAGHLIDARSIGLAGVEWVFGAEVREVVCRRLAAHHLGVCAA